LGNLKGIRKVARMKLDCMEVEFTYGVRMSMDAAREVGALAKEKGISLSVHAPYYINLASDEKEKIVASKRRILDSCERAAVNGASWIPAKGPPRLAPAAWFFMPGFIRRKRLSRPMR
jgi:deoxyribonuclease-4